MVGRLVLGCVLLAACAGHSHETPDAALLPPQGCDAQDGDGDGIAIVVPYHGAPRPMSKDLTVATKLARADVAILLDTSGSMLGTDTRIQGEFRKLVTMLAGQIDDLAFAAAGIGDFPVNDGANSQYDVPYYLVHRVMTARTAMGLQSLVGAMTFKNIITDGLGPWFAGMRGGDEPEQGWEALRQVATGTGISYPSPLTGTAAVPAFDPMHAYPAHPPAGEEQGTIGGLGFRRDSLPIILVVTDTSQHDSVLTTTNPHSANRMVAAQALAQIGARVLGINTYAATGTADLTWIATTTGAQVTPDAWGTGAARPANCPVGRCCLVADDPSVGGTAVQPLPVGGTCTLVFQSDRYDDNLAKMLAQAITAVARGVRFDAGAKVVDDPGDTVDAVAAFVDHVEAVADGACAGASAVDRDGDGVPDTFTAVLPGSNACFRITARINDSVPPADGPVKYRAWLQPTANGLGDLAPQEIWFVVPASDCSGGVVAAARSR